LLTEAGDAASPATMAAVAETLQVLPFSSTNGRLTRPLQPVGFGALAGLMGAAATNSRVADVVSIEKGRRPRRDETRQDDAESRRVADERRAGIARLEFELAAARKTEIAADAKASAAEHEVRQAKKACARLRTELDEADDESRRKVEDATARLRQAREARAARERIEDELRRLQSRT
jgi:hypothetical protein